MSYLELARRARRGEPEPKESVNAPAPVADVRTARPVRRDPDERRLLAAGWTPKDRCGPLELTIWADPSTGFYYSREIALHRLDQSNDTTEAGA